MQIISARAGVALCTILLLGGCRLNVISEEGGTVSSGSGNYDCASGQTCSQELPPGVFSETFTAAAAADYRFAGWTGLCTEGANASTASCSVLLPEAFTALAGEIDLVANFNRPVVGTWLSGDLADPDGFVLLTLYEDEVYQTVRSAPDDTTAINQQGGYAYGTYTWDPAVEELSGNLAYLESQGSIGYEGGTVDGTPYYKHAVVSGDELALTVRFRFGGGLDVWQRITNGQGDAITGTWSIGDTAIFEEFSQITFYNGLFLVTEYCGDVSVGGGWQYGTYSWDESTGDLSLTVLRDTTSGCGPDSTVGQLANVQSARSRGDSLLLTAGKKKLVANALR